MPPTPIQQRLPALAKAFPTEHLFTLSLRLQAATGREISGAQAAKMLEVVGQD